MLIYLRKTKFFGEINLISGELSKKGYAEMPEKALLPTIRIGMGKFEISIFLAIALVVLCYIYFKKTKHGYEISVVGESENTARYIGINVKKVIIRTVLVSGAVCGITGFLLVSGTHHTITAETVGGQGFTAIMVSWLAKFNPFVMAGVSFLITFLERGAGEIATILRLNQSVAAIMQGVILFFIIGSEFFINYKVNFRSGKKEGKK